MRKTIVYIFVNRYKVTTNKQTKKKREKEKSPSFMPLLPSWYQKHYVCLIVG